MDKKMGFLRNLLDSHGTISASRFMMFLTIILGFILNLIMVYELGSNIINIGMWGVLFGSILPIAGILGYVLAKGFETKLELKFGDKEINLGSNGVKAKETQTNAETKE